MNLAYFSSNNLNCFEAENDMLDVKNGTKRGISVFFDRDGIVNIDTGYVHEFNSDLIYDSFIDCLRYLSVNGIKTGVATNQSGISRGLYSWADFELFQIKLNCYLSVLSLPPLDAISCSWHPEFSAAKCFRHWRKPGPNMLLFLCIVNGAAPENSIFVGDKSSDVQAAISAGFHAVIKVDDRYSCGMKAGSSTIVTLAPRDQLQSVLADTIKNLRGVK